ncbi:HAD-IIIC family phosphatase [Clostridium beijerinckii]|uniref:HAD-IIIC family phosphatase n=1 Tax=Clostridium beijerinckii TaxID=1520 RepID=UPI0022E94744|nr:HAD-IIIC family phosphatase [Clostridium beijerinckii]
MKLSEIQKQMNSNSILNEQLNIIVISNITFEPYLNLIIKNIFSQDGIYLDIAFINYDEYKSSESLDKITKTDYIVIYLDFDYLFPDATNNLLANKLTTNELIENTKIKSQELYDYLKELTQSPIFWFGFEDYCYQYNQFKGSIPFNDNLIDRINNELYKLLENKDIYIDFKRLIANVGIKNAYDNKGKYRWNSHYTQETIIQMCNELYKQHLIQNGISKKCIVLDCDNVLWGGVLSEDGIENISLGSHGVGRSFQDFQRYLLTLYYHGVILTVCSKNDLSDVKNMFKEHSEMILKEEHIASFKVNWNNKSENIKSISETLNIGLDSMVFIDDSDFEIQSVKAVLPEVTTIRYNRTTIYEELLCFNLKKYMDINKIKQRNDTYKTSGQREVLKSECKSFEEYLEALEMKIDIHKALPIEVNRIAELTQRTNKCTNGKRYTVNKLKEQLGKNEYTLYSVSVLDKFSDLGIIGAIGINSGTLDLFSLSCRALGRNIEDKMIETILKENICNFIFSPTGKNDELRLKLETNIKKK